MTFLFLYWVDLTFGGREHKLGGEAVNELIFGWWGDSPIPPVGKTVYKLWSSVHITYIMFQSGHLTSERFEHFACHRYILYIFSLVCSVFIIQYIYHIMNMFNQAQCSKKYLSKEYLSLTSNLLVHDVKNLLYICIGQNLQTIKHRVKWMVKFVKT